MQQFKKEGLSFLNSLTEKQIANILEQANKEYHSNTTPTLTDNEFDIIKEYMENKYPNNPKLKEVGAPILNEKKVILPYEMWSMDKIKPDTNALEKWNKKYLGPYVISCKLDGVSGLYSTEGGKQKLYTRGNGIVGQDISSIIPHLNIPNIKDIVVRGEFIIPKKIFTSKYSKQFANPRNLVAGIINKINICEKIKDIHFVAYEIIVPEKTPLEQLQLLEKMGFEVVLYQLNKNITNETLSQTLVTWRKDYIYEIDGIIITSNKLYKRKSGNPLHSIAFKMVLSDQIAEAKVVDVIWSASKDGYLKPRIRIEPIKLGGVTIEYATGFNAAFIEKNKIGVGSLIEIIRSGDVIPHIRQVIQSSDKPLMPNVPYKWNKTRVDIILENPHLDSDVLEKNITAFFKGINVEGLGRGNIARFIQHGYDTIPKILNMTINDFLNIEGFKDKMATKIYNSIHEKMQSASLITLMSASNIFGRGFDEKRIELIINAYPDILTSNVSSINKINLLKEIKGMGEKTAESFVNHIPEFMNFIKQQKLQNKLNYSPSKKNIIHHQLNNKSIVITGFRDKDLMSEIEKAGGKIASSVSKNTLVVIVKNKQDNTSKINEAKKIGIPIMLPNEFMKTYFNK